MTRDAGDWGCHRSYTSISTHTRTGGSHVSRNARIPMARGRRMALTSGTAAGAAAIAASFSVGTAPTGTAPTSSAQMRSATLIGGTRSASALSAASVAETALPAATETVPAADAISYLIEAFDPELSSTLRACRRTRSACWATTLTTTCCFRPALMPRSNRTSWTWWVPSRERRDPRLNRRHSATWSRQSTRTRLPGTLQCAD